MQDLHERISGSRTLILALLAQLKGTEDCMLTSLSDYDYAADKAEFAKNLKATLDYTIKDAEKYLEHLMSRSSGTKPVVEKTVQDLEEFARKLDAFSKDVLIDFEKIGIKLSPDE